MTENIIKMAKLENGNYCATIPNTKDTLGYQILLNIADRQRSINGQKATFYKPNAGYDYISYIVSNAPKIYIEFNPKKLTESQIAASIESDNVVFEKIAQYQDALMILLMNRDTRFFELIEKDELTDAIHDSLKAIPVMKIDSLFTNAKEEELKILFALSYVEYLCWSGITGGIIKDFEINKNIINYLTTNFPTNYFSMNGCFFDLCVIESDLAHEDVLLNKRLQTHLKNIDKKSGQYTYMCQEIVNHFMKQQDTLNAKLFYDVLINDFSNSSATFSVEAKYNLYGNKKIVVGNMIPDFELPNVDNPDDIISMQKLRGKWLLIDIWYQGCAPCIAEIPNFRKMYKKYKSQDFIIYSISFDSPDSIKKFKSKENYSMPWLHSYLDEGNYKSHVAQLLETYGVPHCILVAPDGKIAALKRLRGNSLDETLDKFINNK
jgi:peroxiredoxin